MINVRLCTSNAKNSPPAFVLQKKYEKSKITNFIPPVLRFNVHDIHVGRPTDNIYTFIHKY